MAQEETDFYTLWPQQLMFDYQSSKAVKTQPTMMIGLLIMIIVHMCWIQIVVHEDMFLKVWIDKVGCKPDC
jgi:hypothetical protein